MKKLFTLLFSLSLFVAYGQIYVNHAASGDNDGSSWEHAYTDLKIAIDSAQDNDTLWVAQGIYKPADASGMPDATFLILDDLVLLGGFAGGEQNPNQRDPDANPTILSGDLLGNDTLGNFEMNRDDNAQTVVLIGSGATVTIDGFTIQNGHAEGTGANEEIRGGGLYCRSNSTVTIRQCDFFENYASGGGGIWVNEADFFTLDQCTLKNNNAGAGGGMRFFSLAGLIKDCTFEGNQASLGGGGMNATFRADFSGEPDLQLINCQFMSNVSGDTGGGFRFFSYKDDTEVLLRNCTFLQNESKFGGAVRLDAWIDAMNPDPKNLSIAIDSCSFHQNQATAGGAGGGLFAGFLHKNCSFSLTHSTFTQNQADFYGGGAVLYGDYAGEGEIILNDCRFEKNFGGEDAGGLFIGSDLNTEKFTYHLTDCHFTENQAGIYGGGMELWIAPTTENAENVFVEDCTWTGNMSGGIAGGLGINNTNPGLTALFRNCAFQGNQSPFGAAIAADTFYNYPVTLADTASIRFENCLLTGNDSNYAIAARNTGELFFLNCTVADNTAGGIGLDNNSAMSLQNTILSNPGMEFTELTGDVSILSKGGNLISDASLNAILLPLLDKQTQPLFENGYYPTEESPQVNGGVNEGVTSEYDLDGNLRKKGFVDIGALESDYKVAVREVLAVEPLQAFPNPAKETVFVEWPEGISCPVEVQLYDLQGRLLHQENLPIGRGLNVKSLPSGLFLLKATVNGKYFIAKFSKN